MEDREKQIVDNLRIKDDLNTARELFFINTQMLSEIIDAKDPYTEGHSERVRLFSVEIGKDLRLSTKDMAVLSLAAKLHDIGKLKIPDNILKKPGPLSPAERNEIERHSIYSEQLLGKHPALEPVLSAIRSHHERLSGQGYPDKLEGEMIPFLSKIITVSDVFDAMTSHRVYRKGVYTDEETVSYIEKNSGIFFDGIIVKSFVKLFKRGVFDFCNGEYLRRLYPQKAYEYYIKALSKCKTDKWKEVILFRLGNILNALWKPIEAISYLEKALSYKGEYRYRIMNEIAFSNYYMGNVNALYENFINIKKEEANVPLIEIIRTYFSLLLYYSRKYDFDKAYSIVNDLEMMFEEVKRGEYLLANEDLLVGIEKKRLMFDDFIYLQSKSYNMMADIMRNQGEFKKAHRYYNLSIGLKAISGDILGRAMTLYGSALAYLQEGNLKKAKIVALNCLSSNYENIDKYGIYLANILIADIYREMNQLDKAIFFLIKAKELIKFTKKNDDYYKYYISNWLYMIKTGKEIDVIKGIEKAIDSEDYSIIVKGDILYCYAMALESFDMVDAKEKYKKSLEIYRQLNQIPNIKKIENRLKFIKSLKN